MSDFVPGEFLTLSDAVNYAGHHLFQPDWTGREIRQLRRPPPKRTLRRLERTISELRNLMASEQVQPIALAHNGERFRVPISVWLSKDGRDVFNWGLLSPGSLRDQLKAEREGTLVRRILVPKAQLQGAFGRTGAKPAYRTPGKYSKTDLRNWYQEYVDSCTQDGRIPSRDEELNAARAAIGDGVPREAVREARRQFAPPEWKQQGRRKTGGK